MFEWLRIRRNTQALRSPDSQTRLIATHSLATLRSKGANLSLLVAFKDEDVRISVIAAEALQYKADDRTVECLVESLNDPNKQVRFLASRGLERMGWMPTTLQHKIAWIIARQDNPTIPKLAALGLVAAPALIASLRHPYARYEAMMALGQLGDPCAVEPLRDAIGANSHDCRVAIKALGMINNMEAVSIIGQALAHRDWDVRHTAVDVLRAIISHEDSECSVTAKAILSNYVLNNRFELIRLLGSSTAEDRQVAAVMLGSLDSIIPEAVPALLGSLNTPPAGVDSWQVSEWQAVCAAARTLITMGESAVAICVLKAWFIKGGRGDDADPRTAGMRIVAAMGVDGLPALVDYLVYCRDCGHYVWYGKELVLGALAGMGPVAASAVPEIASLLNDTFSNVREAAASALSAIGSAAL